MLHGIWRFAATLVFVLLMMGMNTSVQAQQTPIAYEQAIQGNLENTDPTFEDGSYYDQYIFQAEAGKPYVITVRSDMFSAYVELRFGEQILQVAFVVQPGAQVQFSGTLNQPGQYTIVVTSFEAAVLGTYNLTLSEYAGVGGPVPPSPSSDLSEFQVGVCGVCGPSRDICTEGLECLLVPGFPYVCAKNDSEAISCQSTGVIKGQRCNLCDPLQQIPIGTCDFGLQCMPVGNNQIPACVQTQQDVEDCGNRIDAALQND